MPGYYSSMVAYPHSDGGTIVYRTVGPGLWETLYSPWLFDERPMVGPVRGPLRWRRRCGFYRSPLRFRRRLLQRERLRLLLWRTWSRSDRPISMSDAEVSDAEVDYLSGIFAGVYD